MKRFQKHLVALTLTGCMIAPLVGYAAYNPQAVIFDPNNNVQRNTGLGNASPTDVAAGIINWVLGILALLALVLVIYGGFIWLLSAGKEEEVERARGILLGALYGLVIILASYGLTAYVFQNLINATTS